MDRKWPCLECKDVGSWLGTLCNRCLHREHRDRWMLLPAPTQAEIDDAISWTEATHDPERVATGFYVVAPDGTDQGEEFCREHADALSAVLGEGSYVGNASGGETDSERWCGHEGCDKQLDVGTFTDEGERSVLGLTEDDPMRAGTILCSLWRIGWNMSPSNPRAALWIYHVDEHRQQEADQLAAAHHPHPEATR